MEYTENPENNPWFTKDRSESASKRIHRMFKNITVSNPGLGLNIYERAIPEEVSNKSIKTLEDNLTNGNKYFWSDAQVTNSNKAIKFARDCVDFKFKPENLGPKDESNSALIDMQQLE